jgi:hypothetical protein
MQAEAMHLLDYLFIHNCSSPSRRAIPGLQFPAAADFHHVSAKPGGTAPLHFRADTSEYQA